MGCLECGWLGEGSALGYKVCIACNCLQWSADGFVCDSGSVRMYVRMHVCTYVDAVCVC